MASYYDSFETYKIELPYVVSGWLDTRGKFYECDWGDHTSLAFDIMREHNGWYLDYHNARGKYISENGRDYLVREKNFILLDCPYCNNKTQLMTFNPLKKHTKSQINKLLELFEYNGDMTMYIMENIR